MNNYELLKLNKDLLICQSCDMPMTKQEDLGIEKDDSLNRNYCHHCYENSELHKGITMDKLICDVQQLLKIEALYPSLLSPLLLKYIEEWLVFDEYNKIASVMTLHSELVDGQDCDYTGTQWEKIWLDDGRVCHCDACVAARKCISDIKLMGVSHER